MQEFIAQAPCGMARGMEDGGTAAWKGLPYAQPPARFSPPQAVRPWTGVRDALEFGPSCPQEDIRRAPMAEDCLYLNIWSPGTAGKRPVMFFIHGGSFAGGSGSEEAYNGANLARNGDVVVVTFNYRVGILGFLDFSFVHSDFHANCGLLDVLEALRWVRTNIAAFGDIRRTLPCLGSRRGGRSQACFPCSRQRGGFFQNVS